jgi:adenylosuccinate lyase
MPHKRNPIVCERVCGLARVVRGNLQAALENVALWHERDISHSSAERVILPDSTIAVDYMVHLFTGVLEGLRVFPDRMRENLDSGGGLAFSQGVLLALIDKGMTREDAYRAVQQAAAAAWDDGKEFMVEVAASPEVRHHLDPAELDALFDPRAHLAHLDPVFTRLQKLEVRA